MSVCKYCGTQNQRGAQFCRMCRTALTQKPPPPPPPPNRGPWLAVANVMHHPDRQWAVWGGLAAFLGSFMPWTQSAISLLGITLGFVGSGAPQPMIVALGALIAIVLAFYRPGGNAILVIGAILTLAVVTFALGAASSHPSWGLLVTLAGTAMIAYSGYRIRYVR